MIESQTVLNKSFNAVLEGPSITLPELTSAEQNTPGAVIKGVVEGTPARSVVIHELTRTQLVFLDSVPVDASQGILSLKLINLLNQPFVF